jgi:rhomboid protease GluP
MTPRDPPPFTTRRPRSAFWSSPVTVALVAIIAAVFVATSLDADQRILVAFAKVNERVLAGEVWRLFTASFLHAGIAHLGFNALALASIGPAVERIYGKARYLVLFLVGGAAGFAASVAFTPGPSVGASAGLFALLGALLVYAVRSRPWVPAPVRSAMLRQVLTIVALNLVIGFSAGFIDNAGHIGGLVGGIAIALALWPRAAAGAAPPAESGGPAPSARVRTD